MRPAAGLAEFIPRKAEPGQVTGAAETGLTCAAGRPGFSLVIAQPDGDVDPIAAQARCVPAVSPLQIVWVGKAISPGMSPSDCRTRTMPAMQIGSMGKSSNRGRDQPPIPGRLAAAVEHPRPCPMTATPAPPAPMGPVAQLNAVGRTRRQYLPVIVAAKVLARLGDLNRFSPGRAIVMTAPGKTPHIFEAVEKMYRPGFVVDDATGLLTSVVTEPVEVLGRSNRVHRQLTFDMDDLLTRQPGLSAIGAPPQHHVDRPPVAAGVAAGFAIGQLRARFGDRDAGNTIDRVPCLPASKRSVLVGVAGVAAGTVVARLPTANSSMRLRKAA
jgi:hypothetical protein